MTGARTRRYAGALAAALASIQLLAVGAAGTTIPAEGPWFACASGSGQLTTPSGEVSVAQGGTVSIPIDIVRVGCPDEIGLSLYDVAPPGSVVTLTPASTTGSSVTLTVTPTAATPVTAYLLQIAVSTGHSYPGPYLGITLTVDPSITPIMTAPTAALRAGATIGSSTVPVRIAWAATDPDGIRSFTVQRQKNGGSWVTLRLSSSAARSITQSLEFGATYRYRARATDRVGHRSGWAYGRTFKPKLVQQTTSALSSNWSWQTRYASGASGGSFKSLPYSGADFTLRRTWASVGWVAVRGPTRSDEVAVWVDGVLRTSTLRLTSGSVAYRRIVFVSNAGSNAVRTLEALNMGTQGTTRMDIDAFVLLVNV